MSFNSVGDLNQFPLGYINDSLTELTIAACTNNELLQHYFQHNKLDFETLLKSIIAS